MKRHKVFVSYHNADQRYKDQFVNKMTGNVVDKSIEDGDIDDKNLSVDTIREKIRDDFIADATVTVVLIGTCTWQRKHVDWEISSSLRETKKNSRCGLLGIRLPSHPDYKKSPSLPSRKLLPPRLADNCNRNVAYAQIYDWSGSKSDFQKWIHKAFTKRDTVLPSNGRLQFRYNKRGDCLKGWQD